MTSSYDYDSLDRLTSSTNGVDQTTSYAYDLANEPTQTSYPAGILPYATTPTPLATGGANTAYTYDLAGRLKTAGSTIQATFGYDNADNLTSLAATAGATPQIYDTANALTRQTDRTGTTTTSTFAYDPQGNRTSQA